MVEGWIIFPVWYELCFAYTLGFGSIIEKENTKMEKYRKRKEQNKTKSTNYNSY